MLVAVANVKQSPGASMYRVSPLSAAAAESTAEPVSVPAPVSAAAAPVSPAAAPVSFAAGVVLHAPSAKRAERAKGERRIVETSEKEEVSL